jgi:hypothetical protein
MANVKLSQIGGGTPVAYNRTTDTPVAVRNGTTDVLLSNVQEQVPPIIACGASKAITAAMSGQTIALNTASGSVATLPAATGSGARFRFVVSVAATSGAHKILAHSSSDFLIGLAIGENAGAPTVFASPAATNHSLQMPFAGSQPSGGLLGDWFEVEDLAANVWHVKGAFQAGTTPTTPFSTATS